jgi:hypothetical protein
MPNLSARLFGINLQHRLDGTEAFATQDCHLGPALPLVGLAPSTAPLHRERPKPPLSPPEVLDGY